jgi:hypothetical protein
MRWAVQQPFTDRGPVTGNPDTEAISCQVHHCRLLARSASCRMFGGERIALACVRSSVGLGGDVLKSLLVCFLALPLYGHSQSYADSPFYKSISAIPASARVEYTPHGNIKANGIVIDLSVSDWRRSVPETSSEFDESIGSAEQADVDRNGPARVFRFYIEYPSLNVTFAYDLLVQPEGTDKIKCTFSAFNDPPYGPRRKDIPILALPADLSPLVIRSGDAIAIRTLPFPESKVEVIHYLRFTRIDLTPASDTAQ